MSFAGLDDLAESDPALFPIFCRYSYLLPLILAVLAASGAASCPAAPKSQAYSAGSSIAGGHNSNSFIAGLLSYAGIRHPSMSTSIFGGFPGWGNPIPTRYFRYIQPIEVVPDDRLIL